MALAGGCVTGMLWKAGAGAAALGIAIAGFAAGELLIRGPADDLIRTLDDASRPDEHALTGLLGAGYGPLALVLGAAALAVLLARRRDGLAPGLALGAVAAATWVAADAAGYGYGLGFVGAAEGTRAGGSVAHGCNIGHGLTGLPLLSLGSLLATASMAAGALIAWRVLLADRPRLRGHERVLSA